MCGLVGFCPKPGKKANFQKLALLSIGNEERGTDNFGISLNDHLIKEAKATKARDFFVLHSKDIKEKIKEDVLIITHARKSSIFHKKDEKHAHPFYFTLGKNNYAIGAHNGKIDNEIELSRKYLNNQRFEVDSEYLFAALINNGKKILQEYEGAAALLFYSTGIFYAFKGGNNNVEERPLFYVETTEGWYFSSIYSVLYLTTGLYPKCVENNELITIKNGIVESEILPRAIEKIIPVYNNHHYTKYYPEEYETTKYVKKIFNHIDDYKEGKWTIPDGVYFMGKNVTTALSIEKTYFYEFPIVVKDGLLYREVNRKYKTLKKKLETCLTREMAKSIVMKNKGLILKTCYEKEVIENPNFGKLGIYISSNELKFYNL